MRILKALSALLTYPSAELIAALPEISALIEADRLLGKNDRAAIGALVSHLKNGDLFDQQEAFGLMFDRTRSLSLHLFEHVHGESRDRGQAMVDLIKVYEEGGFTPTTEELPDFLPLFLEYASTRAPQEALDLFGSVAEMTKQTASHLERNVKTARRRYSGRFAGRLRILATSPRERAQSFERFGERTPRITTAGDLATAKRLIAEMRAFRKAHRIAREAAKSGKRRGLRSGASPRGNKRVTFPAGTGKMHFTYGYPREVYVPLPAA